MGQLKQFALIASAVPLMQTVSILRHSSLKSSAIVCTVCLRSGTVLCLL